MDQERGVPEERLLCRSSNCARDPYGLNAMIAAGFRASSKEAVCFRRWAAGILKEYIQKGFVIDDSLMKEDGPAGVDSFADLLERIKEIRISRRRAFQKIADIFEQCSYDYDKDSEITKTYYSAIFRSLLPGPGKIETDACQAISLSMINHAESAVEQGELLGMEDWLVILNRYINTEEGA